ncbi:PepSY-associated TM helix domain-containing protein [Salinimonas lutimaris]|uniref:PepSY-associated TM helix domain-containing protein n=1 Tax=Salinimonas lutimaris TaxID=914153 RepID=UPI0010BF958E|nr:PepSY-associated TM helix domain-containing protein [Salinimonas lutimaris]
MTRKLITRKQWQTVHRVCGFYLAVLLCFVLFTGSLATVSHELDYLTNPAIRASSTQQPLNWPQVYRSVGQYIPDTHRLSRLQQPEHNNYAIEAIVLDTQQQRYRVYVDPVSYAVTGTGSWMNWQNSLRQLHRHLMLPLWLGVTLVGLLAVTMLVGLVSGWLMLPDWWKVFWQRPRTTNARVFWSDMHKLSGAWSSWLVVVIGLTGVWYLAEQNGLRATYPDTPQAQGQVLPGSLAPVMELTLEQINQQRPAFIPAVWIMPGEAGKPMVVYGRESGLLVRDRANRIVVDPQSGRWLKQWTTPDLTLHQRISEAADPLHFGTWGGLPGKLIYFVFGLLLTSLCITGTYLYALRFLKIKDAPTQGGMLKTGISKMGIWATGSMALIFLALLLYMIG